MSWANRQYDKVGFKHSAFADEYIAVAELNGKKVGLGRLQKVDELTAELGGIYVQEEYRGKGVAAKIVSFLVERSAHYQQVFCLPFAHLEHFYYQYGFNPTLAKIAVPDMVKSKLNWCNTTYQEPTKLLVLRP